MMKYNFQINKDSCFVYWVHSMIDWNRSFDAKKFEYYKKIVGEFSGEEERALEQFKQILQREPGGGYLWIWDRYSGNSIKNSQDAEVWQAVKTVLNKKFEIIWGIEHPKLLNWKKELNDFPFEKLDDIFLSVSSFFGKKVESVITVQLNLFHKNSVTCGYAKREFKNLILLNISSLQMAFLSEAINTLTHETVHQFDYLSDKNNLLKKAFIKAFKSHSCGHKIKKYCLKIKNLLKGKKKGPSWSHLMSESIITSIAGTNNPSNYLNQKKLFQNTEKAKTPLGFRYKDNKVNYSGQIMTVAYCIKDLTKEYLDNNKEMDTDYADRLARVWFNFVTGKTGN